MTKNSKGFAHILLLMVIFLGLAAVGYFAFRNNISKNQTYQPVATQLPKDTNPPSTLTSPVPTTDPTAGWETYNKLDFSVKAPPQLEYRESMSGENLLFLGEGIPKGTTPKFGVDIWFGYLYETDIVECDTDEACYNQMALSFEGAAEAGSRSITTPVSAIIQKKEIKGFRNFTPSLDATGNSMVWLVYPQSHDGKFFQIDIQAYGQSEDEIDNYLETLNLPQILSTFEFVDDMSGEQ